MNPGRSLRVVLATVGSRGDVQPMLALAKEFASRGHVPLIAAPSNFEAWIKSLGFEFAPLAKDVQVLLAENPDMMTGNPVKMVREIGRHLCENLPDQAQQLKLACDKADAMIYGGMAIAAPTIAEHLNLPVLGVLYTSCLLPSSRHPPMSIPWHGLPAWLNNLLWRVNHMVGDSLFRATLNATRAGLGLPPIDHVRRHLLENAPLVIAADEILFPPDPLWRGRYPYANFIFFDDPAPLDPELDAWLADGEPPVFVGFGSMSGAGTDRVARTIVDAISGSGRRCIVGAGWAGLGAGALPPGWRVVRDAPHALLFPRTAVVIHHGGSGTTAQALRAGVPQVVLPLILDQFHHAHRLHLAGIAPHPVPMEKITAAKLAAAIEAALELPAGPRQAAAARLRASDGRGEIVRRVEAMVAA
ncbi:MAG: glycosyltransferase [Sulfuritalea sp.]|jgi:UDP:flavonoid glycosyltransferase YjiC (YdhE family)|nr:glycosyltransferase [Sulfuritalea sp.]